MLRITKFLNRSTTEIQIAFNLQLDDDIGVSNVAIRSNLANARDLEVKSVRVSGRVLSVQIAPQSPNVLYYVELLSTTAQPFQSIDNQIILEDAKQNRFFFIGIENTNDIRDTLIEEAPPTYDFDSNTLPRKFFSMLGDTLLKLRTDIRETGNANYLTETVSDEIQNRGFGPTDRLGNEGAYEIVRASNLPEGQVRVGRLLFNSDIANSLGSDSDKANTQVSGFPTDPVSLKSTSVTESVSNSEQLNNKFEDLTITLSNSNVIRLNTLVLNKANGTQVVYDIPSYGYALQNNRYDTVHARPLVTLGSNQLRLSERAVIDGVFNEPTGSDTLVINYTYIDDGILVDEENESIPLSVTQVKTATRETVGPLLTIFSLANFPIVNSADRVPTVGGVQFTDPNGAVPFVSTHPAFVTEIPFSSARLPAGPGEYAVDYNTGQVFVYGAVTANGTGSAPPVATYMYRRTFRPTVDYNINAEDDELAVVPGRDLAGQEVKIQYAFERVFAPGIDYLAEAHNEVTNEFVENRFSSSFSFYPKNRPITNVFQVLNETTGETYSVQRFTDSEVFLSGSQLPRIQSASNESVNWTRVSGEDLFITDTISSTLTTKIVEAELDNELIVGQFGYNQGANVNSSVSFSRPDLFVREFFYDDELQTLTTNLAKLTTVGDYLINYKKGLVYLFTDIDQGFDLGEVSYQYGTIQTIRSNVFTVNSIGYKKTIRDSSVLDLDIEAINVNSIALQSVQPSVERFLKGNTNKPILLGAVQYGEVGFYNFNSTTFTSADANFTDDLDDGYHILRFEGDSDRTIVSVLSPTEVIVDVPFTSNRSRVAWCVIDFNPAFPAGDGYKTITTYDIDSIRGVYTVSDIQNSDADSLTNLFDSSVDTFSGNTIQFNSSAISALAPGTALAVDYSFGTLFADYDYVLDNVRVTYEYGDNSINWAVSDALSPGEEYFVTYRYGALRNALVSNFAALTRLGELVNIPLDFDRELYRDYLIGTLQGFVAGPTVEAISNLVEQVTRIEPNIRELSFNEWTVGRDNLYLDEGRSDGTLEFDAGKFGSGLIIRDDATLSFPAEAYLSHREGTYEAWVKPFWNGLDNDASLTFSLSQDGYTPADGPGLDDGYTLSLSNIYIGSSAFNPTSMPFTINRMNAAPSSPVGRPVNFGADPGIYIWFDLPSNQWIVSGVADPTLNIRLDGEITSTGDFYNVRDDDGYKLETSDRLTSTKSFVRFAFLFDGYEVSDGYDGYTETDGYFYNDEIRFLSDNVHYLVDSGPSTEHNRFSIFKDGSGFLNLRVYDDSGRRKPGKAKYYNISHDISDWLENDLHHIAASWRLNSAEGIDELHLFVDGQEVSNVFKYGGRPQTTPTDVYRTIAEETLTTSASKTIIGGSDGVSTSSSAIFTSASGTFVSEGIIPGDTLTILDSTADGAGSPYTILTVDSETQITLTSALTLSLTNINFSVNRTTFTLQTNGDIEKIAVFATDGYDVVRELNGVYAVSPDYTITRSGGTNTIALINGIDAGDRITVHSLGLTQGRCRDLIYKYDSDNTLETRVGPPTSLNHFDIFKVPFPRTSIEQGEAPSFPDGYFDGYFEITGSIADGYFTGLCQPSNIVDGKSYSVTLGGLDNIDFTGTNEVVITGSTAGGPPSETLSFTDYGTQTTTNFFTSVDSVDMTFTGVDGYRSFGSIEISEAVPLTQSENSGDYADPAAYNNGRVTFFTFGSGGTPYDLEACFYRLDFPMALNIPMTTKGRVFIGSDIEGNNQWNGLIDQVEFLNEQLEDIRVGEDKGSQRTITQDFNSPLPASVTPQTLMLLNFDNNINNVKRFFKTHSEDVFTTSRSVNENFGDAAVFVDRPLIVDNGSIIFDKNEGSIEFWVSPLIDTLFDESNARYYVDIASLQTELVTSSSVRTLELPSRAKRINSVRLINDNGSGTNFFEGGQLLVDGTTVFLGTDLPGQQTLVRVEYVPIDFNGDRVSIFKDGYGYLNFSIVADDELFLITYPITWRRNTWHRVMATWRTNTIDNKDRMRLFIDGIESGTITYGTPGLLYGSGVVYGAAAVGSLSADFITSDINLTDTFGQVHIGNSFDGNSSSKAKIDNLRFSNAIRRPSRVSGVDIDLNYNANRDAVLPVVEDNTTTALFDFNRVVEETEFLSNLLSKFTPLFLFDIEVDDSFRRIIDSPLAKSLLEQIINRMKPAHTNVFVKFLQDEE